MHINRHLSESPTLAKTSLNLKWRGGGKGQREEVNRRGEKRRKRMTRGKFAELH